MTDNITLPRKHIDYAAHALEHFNKDAPDPLVSEIIHHLRTALAAEQPKHPGYIIGSHWLETAYSRVCAGEAEADVLRDCGWERVDDAEALRRDAERYRWLKAKVEDYDGHACFPQVPYPAPIPDCSPFDAVDAAIDAAMKEGT